MLDYTEFVENEVENVVIFLSKILQEQRSIFDLVFLFFKIRAILLPKKLKKLKNFRNFSSDPVSILFFFFTRFFSVFSIFF